jgi:flagellin
MKIQNTYNPYINQNQKKVEENLSHIANPKLSTKDVNKLIEDILELSADTATQEISNFNDAIGYMQIADGALKSVSSDVNTIKELQVRANNAALNSDNLQAINEEISKLSENINKTLTNTTYNGKSVFNESLNFNGVEISTQMPKFDVENLDDFIKALNENRSKIGSFINEAVDKIDNLNSFVINTKNAKSNFEPDIAKEVSEYKNNSLKLNASLIAQSHNIQTLQKNINSLLG